MMITLGSVLATLALSDRVDSQHHCDTALLGPHPATSSVNFHFVLFMKAPTSLVAALREAKYIYILCTVLETLLSRRLLLATVLFTWDLSSPRT